MAIEEVFFRHPAVALAAVVGEPDAYAGELPVAYVQLKPGASVDAAELLAYVAERTPERAAVPVQLYLIDAVPLTAVGKVFKPALRWDAAERAVRADARPICRRTASTSACRSVRMRSTARSIRVALAGVDGASRAAIEREVHRRLDPLTIKHAVEWA